MVRVKVKGVKILSKTEAQIVLYPNNHRLPMLIEHPKDLWDINKNDILIIRLDKNRNILSTRVEHH